MQATIGRIRVLDEDTTAQIAAGEIIERPVSVVKELVENSLDAGASWIVVELRDGGRAEIAVHDDGHGIVHQDLALALARHGTSKITCAADLFSVRTLGFRGEGLASIAAAAASVEMVSRPAHEDFGTRIVAKGSHVAAAERVAAPAGTKVTVRELFAATPVRRDFLSSEKTELARVSVFLGRIALGWPAVAFSLHSDGREIWSLPAAKDPVDRLEMVFGKGSRGTLVPAHTPARGVVGVEGFTSRIGADRPNRAGQVLFVNGRLVRSPALSAAWSAAYAARIMTGRYPYGVLNVKLEPNDVDVNVHPTKIEVRFLAAATVFDAVRNSIGDALRADTANEESLTAFSMVPGAAQARGSDETILPAMSLLGEFEGLKGSSTAGSPLTRALGQIDQTFIVISDAAGLLILDQHAAHERIAFEALQAQQISPAGPAMLFPRIVELTPDQAATLETCSAELAAMGIAVEHFGDSAYRINALPSGYGERRFDLAGILEDIAGSPHDDHAGDLRRHLLASVACHSVVRAHEALSMQEQVTLYERLRACREPQTCPHGRPTMLRLDAAQLKGAFKRT